ncbi:MAG TPA: APC family permease [Micromonosporaceae bacterium]|jgi:amino acid transporter|nr:APC family permease [Micromonosporaceae bacterium]
MVDQAAQAPVTLRRDAIGLREVLFQSITDMAPGAAIAASIPAGAAFAGGALPLAVLFALIACLFCAVSIAELAKRIPSAGSLATYAAQGLHDSVGFLVAWAYVFAGALIGPLVLLQLGFTVAGTFHDEWHSYPANLWWPWTVLGALIVAVAGLYGVRTSARLGTVLGVFEIAVFLVLGVLLVMHAGKANTLSVFGTGHTPSSGTYHGISGVIAGSVFTTLAFGGFEGAAPLAEEARNPRRTIRRAVLGATLGMGALYIFTTYAVDVAFGPGKFSTFGAATSPGWEGLARTFYGLFWILVFLAIVNSTIANANAGVNVTTRTAFAMGRIGAFPYIFARLALKHRSPYVAIGAVFVVTVAVSLGLGLHYNPFVAFSMVATGIVILLVGIYIFANISCMGYFLRRGRGRSEFNVVLHVIVPILGVVTFIPAWLTAAGIEVSFFKFIVPLPKPLNYAGYAAGIWMVLGVLYCLYLYARHPERVADVSRVHLDEEPAVVAPSGYQPPAQAATGSAADEPTPIA